MTSGNYEELVLKGVEARQRHDQTRKEHDLTRWELGDLALAVEVSHTGRELRDYAAQIGIEYETLRRYRHVAAAYKDVPRGTSISWSHYRDLAAHPDRAQWLRRVEAEGLSLYALRQLLELEKIKEAKIVDAAVTDLLAAPPLFSRKVEGTAPDPMGTPTYPEGTNISMDDYLREVEQRNEKLITPELMQEAAAYVLQDSSDILMKIEAEIQRLQDLYPIEKIVPGVYEIQGKQHLAYHQQRLSDCVAYLAQLVSYFDDFLEVRRIVDA